MSGIYLRTIIIFQNEELPSTGVVLTGIVTREVRSRGFSRKPLTMKKQEEACFKHEKESFHGSGNSHDSIGAFAIVFQDKGPRGRFPGSKAQDRKGCAVCTS